MFVLIIEPDEYWRKMAQQVFLEVGKGKVEILALAKCETLFLHLHQFKPDLVVMSWSAKGPASLQTINSLPHRRDMRVTVLSSLNPERLHHEVKGADTILSKRKMTPRALAFFAAGELEISRHSVTVVLNS